MVLKPGHQRRSVAFRFLVSDECLVLSEDSEAASRIMFVFFPSVSVIPHHIPYIPFGLFNIAMENPPIFHR